MHVRTTGIDVDTPLRSQFSGDAVWIGKSATADEWEMLLANEQQQSEGRCR